MWGKRYGYNASRSFWFGVASMLVFIACVAVVYFAWPTTMQNGEPDILTQTNLEQAATTARYRWAITGWNFVFLGLGLMLFIPYWNYGKSRREHQQVRRSGRTFRMISIAFLFNVYMVYLKICFASGWFFTIIDALQYGSAVFILVLFLFRLLTNPDAKKHESAKEIKIEAKQPKQLHKVLSTLSLFFPSAIVVMELISKVLESFLHINSFEVCVVALLSGLSLPKPFICRNLYDCTVAALPLLAIALFWLNCVYNAPPIVGDPLWFKVPPLKGVYTMAKY